MHSKYYTRFKIISYNPFWKIYLRWAYQKCIDDFQKINYKANFFKKGFTALLCGTSGEVTSTEFVSFVLSKNPKARIIILDIAPKQLERSRIVLSKKFPNAKIKYIQADAKNIPLKDESIDYIETDGILEYFSKGDMNILFKEWSRVLKKNGFVTLRDFATNSLLGRIVDKIRLFVGKKYLGVTLYQHLLDNITNAIKNGKFKHVYGGGTFCPTYRRISLVKF